MVQMRNGVAYALFRSLCPAGDIRRELNSMKEALGPRSQTLEIQVLQLCDASKKAGGNDTGIPASIAAAAALRNVNYIVVAVEKWKTNERTAIALDQVFKSPSEVFRPADISIYYNRNGGPHFQCMTRV